MAKTNTAAKWLTLEQVAERYQVTIPTLHRWRHTNYGPDATRIGRNLRYSVAAIEAFEAWLREQERQRRGA